MTGALITSRTRGRARRAGCWPAKVIGNGLAGLLQLLAVAAAAPAAG